MLFISPYLDLLVCCHMNIYIYFFYVYYYFIYLFIFHWLPLWEWRVGGGGEGAEGVALFVGLTPQLALVLVLGCECEWRMWESIDREENSSTQLRNVQNLYMCKIWDTVEMQSIKCPLGTFWFSTKLTIHIM